MIELLVGVVITTVLASLSLASFTELKQKAYDASARSKVKDIGVACEDLVNQFETDPVNTATEYGIPITGTPPRLAGMFGCMGDASCAARFPALKASRNLTTGYVVAGFDSDLFTGAQNSSANYAFGSLGHDFRIECLGVAFHNKGSKVYYWIPKFGIYADERDGPPSWCEYMPPGVRGC